jgi:hypothetical protein
VVAGTVVRTVVGTGVLITVVTSGEATVVMVSVTGGFACCAVHPLAATRSITRMNKPRVVFMKYD